MTGRREEVLRRIRDELRMRPNISDGVLLALAEQIDPDLAGIDPRSFAGQYLFPARQSLKPSPRRGRRSRPKRRKEPRATSGTVAEPPSPPETAIQARAHEQIRAVLLEFARELAEAGDHAEWVRVLTRVDDHVERVVLFL